MLENYNLYSIIRVDGPQVAQRTVQKLGQMPSSVQDLAFDIQTVQFLADVSGEYDLDDNQSANLTKVVRDVLTGDLPLKNMGAALEHGLAVDQATATKIQSSVMNELLTPIMGDLQVNRQAKPTTTPQNTQPASQKPAPSQSPSPDVNQNNIINLRKPSN